jgi:putative MFS transporter
MMDSLKRRAVVICALGYFIDIFDIQLFTVLRLPSLRALGVSAGHMATVAGTILNQQMLGMILGAFLWGYVGDRLGRLKALYGSILTYSLGTLACSFVQDPTTYGALRFLTGFGLAGETGAAVTLISESTSLQSRGWGVTIVAGFGTFGPAVAIIISGLLPWRLTYAVAAAVGLALFSLRLGLRESPLFETISQVKSIQQDKSSQPRRNLFAHPRQIIDYVCCLAVGLPIIYSFSLLNFYSFELGSSVLKQDVNFSQTICLFSFFIGWGLGDILSGVISQVWRSRRKAVMIFLFLGLSSSLVFLCLGPTAEFSLRAVYGMYFVIGFSSGFWLLFTMISAEHFQTNVRATATITITNIVRGCTIPIIISFQWLQRIIGIDHAAAAIGVILYSFAFLALVCLRETFFYDLKDTNVDFR